MDFKEIWNKTNEYADHANKVIKPLSKGVITGMNKSSEFFNKGAKKSVESLNDVSLRATGTVSKVKCPVCKSTNITFMQNDRKSFSVGKAVGGAILTGGVGAIAGFAGKKGKNQYHCNNCGRNFKSKK